MSDQQDRIRAIKYLYVIRDLLQKVYKMSSENFLISDKNELINFSEEFDKQIQKYIIKIGEIANISER